MIERVGGVLLLGGLSILAAVGLYVAFSVDWTGGVAVLGVLMVLVGVSILSIRCG